MVKARNNISMSSNKSKKSKELRKYEIAYHRCIKMGLRSKQCKKSAKNLKLKSRKHLKIEVSKDIKKSHKRPHVKSRRVPHAESKKSHMIHHSLRSKSKRPLNSYQRFVKKESGKSIYKGQTAKSRMRAISKLWKRSRN